MKKFKSIVFILMLSMIFTLLPSKQAGAYTVHIANTNDNTMEIGIGSGYKLELDALTKKKNAVYCYYTSDKKIVEVNKSTGALKGIKVGKATITCKETIGGKTTIFGTCKVTVNDISIEKGPFSLAIGDELGIVYRTYYSNKAATYQYTSSKSSIASVSNEGSVRAIQAGTAKITIKEVLGGKSRTVGTVTIEVKVATIPKRWGYQYGLREDGIIILTSDTEIHPRLFLNDSISDAVYKFTSKDNTMMTADIRGKVTFLKPLKAGVTTFTVEETYKGKTRIVGTVNAAIDLRRYLVLNPSYFWSSKPSYVTVSEGSEGSIEPLLKAKDIVENILDLTNLDITYTSNNAGVVEVDEKTGNFKAKTPGVATITAVGSENEVEITLKVKEKGGMGEAEVRGKSAIEQINTLTKTEITSANAAELWNKVYKLNHSIDYYPDMDWGGNEPYLYSLTGDENYWAIPNFVKLQDFSKKVVDVLEKEANELLAKQEIVRVSNVKDDSLKIEFKYPLTENFHTYYQAISVEGDAYGAMLSCDLYNITKEGDSYGVLEIKHDAKVVELKLFYKLAKGTYSLQCSELLALEPFTFTYK